jgi:hypothetical protein
MVSLSKVSKEKLEKIFELNGYKVRYEKGHFQSGYCLVQDQKIVVVNKFFDLAGRVEALLDVISLVELDESTLDDKLKKFFKTCLMHSTIAEEVGENNT